MAGKSERRWSRRHFIGGAALLAVAVGVPMAAIRLHELPGDEAPTERQRLLMRRVSDLVIPRTDTAGAAELGVGEFVILALAHGLEGSRAPASSAGTPTYARFRRDDGSLRHLDWLEDELDRRAGGDFLGGPAPRQAQWLGELDAEAYAPDATDHPWKIVKALVLTGYYTSEVGGSKELRYELVPGRWDPDVPLRPGDRAFSSDWSAVDFG